MAASRKRDSEALASNGESGRSHKSLSKTFRCEHEGCGKSYSRAEHLARHQLNHDPRQIFRCEFPKCERWFVRQDLCSRHFERHLQDGNLSPPQSDPIHASIHQPATQTAPKKRRVGRPKLADKRLATPPALATDQASPTEHRDSLPRGAPYQAPGTDETSFQRPLAALNAGDLFNGHPQSSIIPSNTVRRQDTIGGSSTSTLAPQHTLNMNTANMIGPPNTPGLFQNYYDQFGDSPGSARHDEFTNWLFDDLQHFYSGIGPLGLQTQVGISDLPDHVYDTPFSDPTENFAMPSLPQRISLPFDQHTMGEDTWMSEVKWRHLIEFMQLCFNEAASNRGHFDRNEIFSGDFEVDDHLLSFKLMNAYIASYWQSYHEQMPILHKPTFSADDTPDLLLLAIIMIGAAHIPTNMGEYVKDNAHHFATFVAWHLRWHIFMHDDFHPPAKLWVFQALIMLEVFEKLKATRFLHERANLHNATTINLIRRGTALTDASAMPDMAGGGMSPKEWWDRWVTAEATRRAAFAAFLVDASHGSMFGHSLVMVAHEIQLPLPCDDALWSATSPSEVGRVEASLYTNNVRPLTFLQGLKRMLSGKKVRTNAFGRMVLLAGLQSVSWHMRQREKASNLGRGMGAPEVWRLTLTRAFDFWKKDFDDDFSHRQRAFMAWQNSGAVADSKTIADYASAMHHLSHIAMQVDIIEAQIMAGAIRVVSRIVTDADRERVGRKLSHWRETPGAEVAFHHAVSLLLDYIPEGSVNDGIPEYSIMDDCLTIRPWTLYYAALTAWCYVFVKQNPSKQFSAASSDSSGAMDSRRVTPEREIVRQFPPPSTHRSRQETSILGRSTITPARPAVSPFTARVQGPDRLVQKFGSTQLSIMLRALEHTLKQSRWELLREAAERLRKAIEMLEAANPT